MYPFFLYMFSVISFQYRDDEIQRLSKELEADKISPMDFLRQLTFENERWTKNFDTFETVAYDDDIEFEDESVDDDNSEDECCESDSAGTQTTECMAIASSSSSQTQHMSFEIDPYEFDETEVVPTPLIQK